MTESWFGPAEMIRTNFVCTAPGCATPAVCRRLCNVHYRRMKRHGSPCDGRASRGARLSWLQENIKRSSDECFAPEFLPTQGYWTFQLGGKAFSAHRWVCETVHGSPPTNRHHAAHSCGNGRLGCVNPKHLYWATPKENNADKRVHGTWQIGEKAPSAKLSAEDVLAIRRLEGQEPRKSLAVIFGVSVSAIDSVINGKTWRYIR